ncbi:MAG: 2Fe-2S iron-sulfur cluster-binding protein [Caldilineaceae bacterium]
MPHNRPARLSSSPMAGKAKWVAGTTVLEAACRLGVEIESICGGHQTCGKCKIFIEEGDFPKFGLRSAQSHVTAPTSREEAYAINWALHPITSELRLSGAT